MDYINLPGAIVLPAPFRRQVTRITKTSCCFPCGRLQCSPLRRLILAAAILSASCSDSIEQPKTDAGADRTINVFPQCNPVVTPTRCPNLSNGSAPVLGTLICATAGSTTGCSEGVNGVGYVLVPSCNLCDPHP